MQGLFVYSDILAYWLNGFSHMWAFLQTNIITFLDRLIGHGGPSIIFFSALRSFILKTDLYQYSILNFIFGMFGISFGFFFVYTLVKWFLNLIT